MKLEVGKSYRTRAGEKVTIINVDDDRNYPFKGDNKNCYKENGRVWRYHEDEIDLIAPWEDDQIQPSKEKVNHPAHYNKHPCGVE